MSSVRDSKRLFFVVSSCCGCFVQICEASAFFFFFSLLSHVASQFASLLFYLLLHLFMADQFAVAASGLFVFFCRSGLFVEVFVPPPLFKSRLAPVHDLFREYNEEVAIYKIKEGKGQHVCFCVLREVTD